MEYDVSLVSENEKLYAYIWAPANAKLAVTCTSFTAQTSIVILNQSDYITINNKIYKFDDEYIEMNEDTFTVLLASLIAETGITITTTNSHLIKFKSEKIFTICDMSYNMKLLTGFFKFEKQISGNEIIGDSVPYYVSTPVLYLVSNLGATNYTNVTNKKAACTGMTTLMKINNTMSHYSPIISGNADFTVQTTANVLSNAYFTVVDQNLNQIKLLNPFVITLKIRTVDG